jgi:predicted dehydrogenase
MDKKKEGGLTRRELLGTAAAFMIVPRHVLGGPGYVPPSDKVTLASIGLGRQGMAVTMELLARPDVQVVAVCDVNKGSKNYAKYGANDLLKMARRLLGPGYENWGKDLASPGFAQLTHTFRTSLGMGGREPAKRVVEAYYGSRKGTASGEYKGCNAYNDFRELLEKEKDLDALYVATPDHWHAGISLTAMRKGKHVLCQKPMAHNIGDARRMAAMARQMKVATSLPVNNPSSEPTKVISEWLADGAIGAVREVHNWSSRPFWEQGVGRPTEADPIPEGFDWDLWLGPAPERPYNKAYLPFVWRGWYDFGDGSFGDMGCYSFAGLFKILNLTPPLTVESSTSESWDETYPKASMVHLNFPANGNRPPLRMSWYDGGLRPPRPAGLKDRDQRFFMGGEEGEGIMYVGDKGYLLAGFNGNNPHVYPESPRYQYQPPERKPGERRPDPAIEQWIAACKGSPQPPLADFEIQSPVTEAFLLGCIAQRFPGQLLEWDTTSMRITNSEKLNAYVDPPYRNAYRLT